MGWDTITLLTILPQVGSHDLVCWFAPLNDVTLRQDSFVNLLACLLVGWLVSSQSAGVRAMAPDEGWNLLYDACMHICNLLA